MKLTPAGVSAALLAVASTAVTALPSLVSGHVISAQLATTIGGLLTAVLAGWHGHAAVVKTAPLTQPPSA